MKVKLEGREYELKANGRFLLKYQEIFKANAVVDLYKSISEKDLLLTEKLTYCAINEELSFEEWLDSFETPLFLMPYMDSILEYLIVGVDPSVKAEKKSDEKKTTSN